MSSIVTKSAMTAERITVCPNEDAPSPRSFRSGITRPTEVVLMMSAMIQGLSR